MFQLQLGLGLEKAVTGMVSAKHADALALAETDEEIQVVQIRIAQEQGGYYLSRTLWLRLVVAFQWLALGAIGVQLLLQRRGEKPPPGVALLW